MTEAVLAALGGGEAAPDRAACASPESPAAAPAGSFDSGAGVPARDDGAPAGESSGSRPREARDGDGPGTHGAGPAADAIRSHFDSLVAQGEALRAEFPDFDLAAALRDPAFLRLTAPALGVGVREAWTALHPETLDARAARRAAEDVRVLLARAASQGTQRPREGGGLEAAALTRSDYRGLSRGEQERLKAAIRAAAARGEKVYP